MANETTSVLTRRLVDDCQGPDAQCDAPYIMNAVNCFHDHAMQYITDLPRDPDSKGQAPSFEALTGMYNALHFKPGPGVKVRGGDDPHYDAIYGPDGIEKSCRLLR